MSSRTGSSFMTFVVTVPLTIAGMVAIFGVPDLSAVNAASADGIVRSPFGEDGWGGDAARFLQGNSPEDAPHFGENKGWSEFAGEADEWNTDSSSAASQDQFGNGSNPFDNQQASPGTPQNRSNTRQPNTSQPNQGRLNIGETSMEYDQRNPNPFPSAERAIGPSHVPSVPSQPAGSQAGNANRLMPNAGTQLPSANRYDWHQASHKLSEMGVKNYHLERGTGDGLFLFVCQFAPSDAPHVQHRFEAEANDPLTAVNQVLNQVEGWLNQRFANQSFPSR